MLVLWHMWRLSLTLMASTSKQGQIQTKHRQATSNKRQDLKQNKTKKLGNCVTRSKRFQKYEKTRLWRIDTTCLVRLCEQWHWLGKPIKDQHTTGEHTQVTAMTGQGGARTRKPTHQTSTWGCYHGNSNAQGGNPDKFGLVLITIIIMWLWYIRRRLCSKANSYCILKSAHKEL